MTQDSAHDTATPSGPGAGFRFVPGDVLSARYKVLRALARGGMGEVYEVDDTHLHEVVALKTLDARLAADAVARARFQGEVKSARRVSHPNVCRIFDFGVHGDGATATHFLTMELLAGETLEQRLRQGLLPRPLVLEVMQQVAGAIDAAHEMGVVHRDLKPSNVMLVRYSGGGTRAVVTDFGIARRVDEATVTRDGWVGTPAYIAPEQLEGKKVDAAADVYSLGVMLFELATGQLPFTGSSAIEVAMQRLARVAPRARDLRPDVPPQWDEAIARCLERAPQDRWPTATEALQAMGTTSPVRARPRRPAAPRASLLLAGLLGLCAAAGVAAWWRTRSPLPAANRVVTVRVSMADGAAPIAMPEGFPPFNDAAAYVVEKQWRALETQRRFRVSHDETGNVVADLRWRAQGKELLATLELAAQGTVVRRVAVRGASLQGLAGQLYPTLAEVVGAGQPAVALWPEEVAEATLLHAPTPEAYAEFIGIFDTYFETISSDDEPLQQRLDALIAQHPTWAHAVVLRMLLLGVNSEAATTLAQRHLALPGIEQDPVGFQLLKDLAHHVVSIQPSHPDRLVGHAFALGLPDNDSEEYSAVQRALAERWPDLQWGANLPSTALSQGRFDVATRELQAWMARAPGQREAWQVLARVNVLQGRPPGPLELLFEADPVLLMALDFLWLVSGDLDRVSDGAGRISVASPRYRAMAQYLLALVDVLKGQLNSAAERLDRAWTLADGHVSGNSFSWTQVTREARRIAEVLGRADAVTRWRQREVEAFERFAWPAPISAANAWATAAQTGTCPAQGPYVDRVAALERTNAARFITRVASTRGCATCAEVLRQGVSPTFEGLLPWTTEYLRCAAEAGAVEVALPLAARSTQVTSVAISGTFDAAVVDTLLARYWHARLLERSGARDAAKAQYGAFLDAWGKADFKSREVQDAAARLAALK